LLGKQQAAAQASAEGADGDVADAADGSKEAAAGAAAPQGSAATAAAGTAAQKTGEGAEESEDDDAEEAADECSAKEMCKATYDLLLLRPGSGRTQKSCSCSNIMYGTSGWGDSTMLFQGNISSWQEVEQALRAARVVGSDDRLHIRAVVESLE
jgi:hypothetical protein